MPLKMRKGAAERRSVLPGGPRRAVRGGHKTERINFQRYFQSGKAMGWTDTEGRGMRESGGAVRRRNGGRETLLCGGEFSGEAPNEREFLRAVILIGCRRRRRADSLTLFIYFCMIRRE